MEKTANVFSIKFFQCDPHSQEYFQLNYSERNFYKYVTIPSYIKFSIKKYRKLTIECNLQVYEIKYTVEISVKHFNNHSNKTPNGTKTPLTLVIVYLQLFREERRAYRDFVVFIHLYEDLKVNLSHPLLLSVLFPLQECLLFSSTSALVHELRLLSQYILIAQLFLRIILKNIKN